MKSHQHATSQIVSYELEASIYNGKLFGCQMTILDSECITAIS